MILSFADDTTQDIYDGRETRAARIIQRQVWPVARRKLDLIDAAHDVVDLRVPPGNRLEKLKGDRAGLWSIRINDQYRVVFTFADGNATNVLITDYH